MRDMQGKSIAFIAVGANIEPEKNICAALAALQKKACVVASSTFYRTEPIGGRNQPKYINGVWRIGTDVSPVTIRNAFLRPIESQLGRCRTGDRLAPRTIDLDLVLYNDLAVNDAELELPHPDVARPFVYVPVVELLKARPGDIEEGLLGRIMRLLPTHAAKIPPGEALPGFTQQLRQLLDLRPAESGLTHLARPREDNS